MTFRLRMLYGRRRVRAGACNCLGRLLLHVALLSLYGILCAVGLKGPGRWAGNCKCCTEPNPCVLHNNIFFPISSARLSATMTFCDVTAAHCQPRLACPGHRLCVGRRRALGTWQGHRRTSSLV